MSEPGNRHVNYEILNLIGYGLAKFSDDFIKQFGFTTKTAFYNYCVEVGVADTVGTVKNRMDLFDPFFPENGRVGCVRAVIEVTTSLDSTKDFGVATLASKTPLT